jgi:hydrogenase maturation protease
MNCAADEYRVLVIGCGNPLRGDDGLGPRAAELLLADPPPATRIVSCHQLLPEMTEMLSAAALAIVIDACVEGPAGTIRCQPVSLPPGDAGDPSPKPSLLGHHLELASLLHLAQTFFGHAPAAMTLSVGAGSFDFSEELSGPVAASLPLLLDRIRRIITEHCAPTERRLACTA